MVNEVIKGFTRAIHTEYPSSEIFVENVMQGLSNKSFLVTSVEATKDKKTVQTYEYEQLISVQYFPESGREEINGVIDTLLDALEVIEVRHGEESTKIRTVHTSTAVVDNVLTMIWRCNDVYFKRPMGDRMDHLEMGVKSDG